MEQKIKIKVMKCTSEISSNLNAVPNYLNKAKFKKEIEKVTKILLIYIEIVMNFILIDQFTLKLIQLFRYLQVIFL